MTTNLTPASREILQALRDNSEGCTSNRKDGTVWQSVYLPNAKPSKMSDHAFAGHLGYLKVAGFYEESGECFGTVKLTD